MSNPLIQLDLRTLLASGADPLGSVLALASQLESGATAQLDAGFDPLPLRKILAAKGFSTSLHKVADGHWRVSLINDGLGHCQILGGVETCSGPGEMDAPLYLTADGEMRLDLRGLPPPVPMVAVLRLVATLTDDQVVTVIHDRDPVYLYPELAELGWELTLFDTQNQTLYFHLRKGG
jgi:uncharacterized protein (DUF2249 family)